MAKLTEAELAEVLRAESEESDLCGKDYWEALARAVAEALGQELAPEGPELAEWFGEACSFYFYRDLLDEPVGELRWFGGGEVTCRDVITLAEGHRRWRKMLDAAKETMEGHKNAFGAVAGEEVLFQGLKEILRIAEGKEG